MSISTRSIKQLLIKSKGTNFTSGFSSVPSLSHGRLHHGQRVRPSQIDASVVLELTPHYRLPTTVGATVTMEQPSIVVTSSPDGSVAVTHEPGASLLTETCATPEYTLLNLGPSAVYAPFVGCVNTRQDCCPFQPQSLVEIGFNDVYPETSDSEQAVLERCPADYYSISASCCPR